MFPFPSPTPISWIPLAVIHVHLSCCFSPLLSTTFSYSSLGPRFMPCLAPIPHLRVLPGTNKVMAPRKFEAREVQSCWGHPTTLPSPCLSLPLEPVACTQCSPSTFLPQLQGPSLPLSVSTKTVTVFPLLVALPHPKCFLSCITPCLSPSWAQEP